MAKRIVVLTDEEIDLVLCWAAHIRDDVLHDIEEEDEEVVEKLRAARLSS